jgi:hypothetical protein
MAINAIDDPILIACNSFCIGRPAQQVLMLAVGQEVRGAFESILAVCGNVPEAVI